MILLWEGMLLGCDGELPFPEKPWKEGTWGDTEGAAICIWRDPCQVLVGRVQAYHWAQTGKSHLLLFTLERNVSRIKSEFSCGNRVFLICGNTVFLSNLCFFDLVFLLFYFAFCLRCRNSPRSKHYNWLTQNKKKILRYLNVLAYACESCKRINKKKNVNHRLKYIRNPVSVELLFYLRLKPTACWWRAFCLRYKIITLSDFHSIYYLNVRQEGQTHLL